MNDTFMIFTAGLGGVFLGMTFLYLAIRCTSYMADWLVNRKNND